MPYMYLYYNNTLLALRAFGFLLTVYIFLSILTPLLLYRLPPRSYLFHPSYPLFVCSVFLPVLFSPSLFHFTASSPHVLDCLSLLVARSVPSFLSFRQYLFSFSSFPHLNLAIIFLSLALSLPHASSFTIP
jgi:hypothetical protein